jgi:hypothetical protein
MLSSRELIRYYVLSVDPILTEHRPSSRMKRVLTRAAPTDDEAQGEKVKTSVPLAAKLAECIVVRERDFGVNDTQFQVVTHLGPLLAAGDYVMGYDLTSRNFNIDDDDTKTLSRIADLPDVILVRKVCWFTYSSNVKVDNVCCFL